MSGEALGLDTSIVLRLLLGEPVEQAQRAFSLLESQAALGRRCLVSDLVVMEAYHALHFHYEVPKKAAITTLSAFLSSSVINASGQVRQVLESMLSASSKPGFVDRMIHEQYRDLGAGLATFEKASSRLSGALIL